MRALISVLPILLAVACASAPQAAGQDGAMVADRAAGYAAKSVRSDRLDSPYWRKHLSEARRLAA